MKIAIIGYGRMGREVERLAVNAGHEVVLRITRSNREELNAAGLHGADAAIDFSLPEAAFANIRLCMQVGVPLVSGVTGWLHRMDEARELVRTHGGSFLYASNFSIGVNLFFAVNRYLAGLMEQQKQYRADIHEIHHIHKLDAPSGTAISLAEDVIARIQRLQRWEGEQGSSPGVLPVTSERLGEVPGTHRVRWQSAIDTIYIEHEAHSREGFAAGAIAAAEWVQGKTGYFTMQDMLGLAP